MKWLCHFINILKIITDLGRRGAFTIEYEEFDRVNKMQGNLMSSEIGWDQFSRYSFVVVLVDETVIH